jgi:hypothetical protein
MRTIARRLPQGAGACGQQSGAVHKKRRSGAAGKANNQSRPILIPDGVYQGIAPACLKTGQQVCFGGCNVNIAGT